MGSFVPAESALLPIVDRVFTRIGAADNLARGRSTFMVEMTETAVILNTATPRSLIVLDEIGRGTSTYDGLALAWAVIEHIHRPHPRENSFRDPLSRTNRTSRQLQGVRNLHVSVKESGDQILFLRRVEPGAADSSYGIEVARLAALPMSVIERARQILAHARKTSSRRTRPVQIQLFEPINHEIADRIRKLNVDRTPPDRSPATARRSPEGAEIMMPLCAHAVHAHRATVASTSPMPKNVAGMMSGTSLDGIDVAIVDIARKRGGVRVKPVAFRSTPYPKLVREAILAVSNSMTHTATISRLNFLLGELYATAIHETCRRARIPLDSIVLAGMHGQTIFHEGEPVEYLGHRVASTLQIGEAAMVAERTGIWTISNFRERDIAAGGKGAPLVPYVDYLLFRHRRIGRVALNIGGIANITVIPAGAEREDVIAFDTGPGNMIIDALVAHMTEGRQTLRPRRPHRPPAARSIRACSSPC